MLYWTVYGISMCGFVHLISWYALIMHEAYFTVYELVVCSGQQRPSTARLIGSTRYRARACGVMT